MKHVLLGYTSVPYSGTQFLLGILRAHEDLGFTRFFPIDRVKGRDEYNALRTILDRQMVDYTLHSEGHVDSDPDLYKYPYILMFAHVGNAEWFFSIGASPLLTKIIAPVRHPYYTLRTRWRWDIREPFVEPSQFTEHVHWMYQLLSLTARGQNHQFLLVPVDLLGMLSSDARVYEMCRLWQWLLEADPAPHIEARIRKWAPLSELSKEETPIRVHEVVCQTVRESPIIDCFNMCGIPYKQSMDDEVPPFSFPAWID